MYALVPLTLAAGMIPEVDKRTDDPVARRGREQIIHDQHAEARAENGGLNRRNPISPTNPRRDEYLEAGRRLDDQ